MSDDHRPMAWIKEGWTPISASDVAPPVHRLAGDVGVKVSLKALNEKGTGGDGAIFS